MTDYLWKEYKNGSKLIKKENKKMSLNKSKVIAHINNYLESEKNYYPKAIFEDVKINVDFIEE